MCFVRLFLGGFFFFFLGGGKFFVFFLKVSKVFLALLISFVPRLFIVCFLDFFS